MVRAFRLVSAFWPCCCSFPFWCWSYLVLCSVCVGLGFGPGPSLVLCLWPSVFSLHCLASCAALILRCMLVHVAVLAFAAR